MKQNNNNNNFVIHTLVVKIHWQYYMDELKYILNYVQDELKGSGQKRPN